MRMMYHITQVQLNQRAKKKRQEGWRNRDGLAVTVLQRPLLNYTLFIFNDKKAANCLGK